MADIFISYARPDRPKIEKLAAALEAEGYSVWWDRQIVGGSQFSEAIEAELKVAKSVIVAWSEHSTKSRWVKDEAGTAAESGKLIPVAIDASVAPMGFKQYHVIDLGGWNGNAESGEIKDVVRAVSAQITGKAAPVASAPPKKWYHHLIDSRKSARDNVISTLIKAIAVVAVVYLGITNGPNSKSPDEDAANAPVSESSAETVGRHSGRQGQFSIGGRRRRSDVAFKLNCGFAIRRFERSRRPRVFRRWDL